MPSYEELLALAIEGKLGGSARANAGTSRLAGALALPTQDSGVFGTLNAGDFLGLDPAQVADIAKTRSALRYQDIMSNLGVLEFAQKAQGIPEQRALENALILEDVKGKNELARVKTAGRSLAGHDPIRVMQAAIIQRMAKGDQTVSQVEKDLAGSILEDKLPKNLLAQIISDRSAYLDAINKGIPREKAALLYGLGADESVYNEAIRQIGASITSKSTHSSSTSSRFTVEKEDKK